MLAGGPISYASSRQTSRQTPTVTSMVEAKLIATAYCGKEAVYLSNKYDNFTSVPLFGDNTGALPWAGNR